MSNNVGKCRDCTHQHEGWCYRFPPQVILNNTATYGWHFVQKAPKVEAWNWCGEFKERIKAEMNNE